MFGALGSPPSYTALGWQDQKTKNILDFLLWGNYKTRRKIESKAKPELTEVAEATEAYERYQPVCVMRLRISEL